MTHKIVVACWLLICFGLIHVHAQTPNYNYKRKSGARRSGYKSGSKYGSKYNYRNRARSKYGSRRQSVADEQTDLESLEASGVEIRTIEMKPRAAVKTENSAANAAPERTLAPEKFAAAPPFVVEHPLALQTIVEKAVAETLEKFAAKKLSGENLAATIIDLRDPNNLKAADYHGDIKIYPASVIKLFYLAAAHRWLEDNRIKDTPELQRGIKDMIVESSNDATGYLVDVLAGVGSGAELPAEEFEAWAFKRNAVNRYFAALGYTNINVNQKAFCEDAYGREQQFRGRDGANRNKLTTNATARLLAEIVLKRVVNPARSEQMMALLKRDPAKEGVDILSQDTAFTGAALKEANVKLWSKAGWTSTTRHDAAYVETADGLKFVIVTFTENVSDEREIIPNIARVVLEEMRKTNKIQTAQNKN